jgi:hypothetical protein
MVFRLHRRRTWGDVASGDAMRIREFAKTEADARAKMLIYLIENKLVSLL